MEASELYFHQLMLFYFHKEIENIVKIAKSTDYGEGTIAESNVGKW